MKNKKLKLLSLVCLSSFAFSFLLVPIVFAQQAVTGGPSTIDELITLIDRIGKWFQAIVLLIAIIMIIYAGLVWMTAGGDEEKLGRARKTLIWGLIGLGIVIFAFAAQSFILSIIG